MQPLLNHALGDRPLPLAQRDRLQPAGEAARVGKLEQRIDGIGARLR